MSFRRSSRARTTQPAPSAPQHTHSSTSSNSLTRAERSTRSHQKLQSPNASSTQRSESLENVEASSRDTLGTRRSRRNDTDIDEHAKENGEEEDLDDPEGEEVTRCICGHPEYPGPPRPSRDNILRGVPKPAVKVENPQNGSIVDSDLFSDDTGNFFIQCDNCQVWQHGGCVGLVDEAQTPDEYFCEQCRPGLHKLVRGSNGSRPRSSRYLPVVAASSPSSESLTSQEETPQDDRLRLSVASLSTKRRATMNSREAAYDEEEILKRVLEESKETSGPLGKRGREDGDDSKQSSKRQRVSSGSPSSALSRRSRSPSGPSLDNPMLAEGSKSAGGSRKVRSTAVKSQQEKEIRERLSEREKQRLEQASKRNARSERRRAEDSPPPSPSHSPSKSANPNSTAASSHRSQAPDTPTSHRANLISHKKTGRPPAKRGRLGRNQYTRDMPINGEGSPMRDTGRDGGVRGSPSIGVNGANGIHSESGKPSRPKSHASKTSINEMKKRVAAILEFINQMHPAKGSSIDGSISTPNGATSNGSNGINKKTVIDPNALVKGVDAGLSGHLSGTEEKEKIFTAMDSKEMMHNLSRDLVGWQAIHGRYGEK